MMKWKSLLNVHIPFFQNPNTVTAVTIQNPKSSYKHPRALHTSTYLSRRSKSKAHSPYHHIF